MGVNINPKTNLNRESLIDNSCSPRAINTKSPKGLFEKMVLGIKFHPRRDPKGGKKFRETKSNSSVHEFLQLPFSLFLKFLPFNLLLSWFRVFTKRIIRATIKISILPISEL